MNSSTAQTTTSDDEGASKLCNSQLYGSVSGEQSDSVFWPLTICDPLTKECWEQHVSSIIAGRLAEVCRQENTSIYKQSTILDDPVTELCGHLQISSVTAKHTDTGVALGAVCDPHTGKCIEPKRNPFVCVAGKTKIDIYHSVISGEENTINPMFIVCIPGTGIYHNNHRSFGIAKPRSAA